MGKLIEKLFGIFRTWETRFALTFVSLVVALALWAYDHFREQNPRLRMEVLSRANVIDVKEQVSDLDVIYKGASLRSNSQTLAVVTLRISNDGAASIPITAYDPVAPLGVEISTKDVSSNLSSNGLSLPFSLSVEPVITKAEVILASRNYFLKNLNVRHTATNAIFNPVIIQAGDWFQIKLLVLHGEGKDFDLSPLGEIAGVKEITFTRLGAKDAPKSVWAQAFGGSFFIQVLRILIYFLLVLCFLVFLAMFLPALARAKYRARDISDRNNRKIKVVAFKTKQLKMESPSFSPEFDWLLDYYIKNGEISLLVLNNIINDERGLKKSQVLGLNYIETYPVLMDRKVLRFENNRYIVDPSFAKSFKALGEFVIPDFENRSNNFFEPALKVKYPEIKINQRKAQ